MGEYTGRLVSPVEMASRAMHRGFGPLEPAPGRRVRYRIDPGRSRVEFAVRFLGFMTVRGTVSGLTGLIRYHTADPREWGVDAEISLQSLATGIAIRDAHLRSRDYLNVAEHPSCTFRSSAVEARESELWVHGLLTLCGIAKPVIVRASYPAPPVRGADGAETVMLEGGFEFNRRTFGILGHRPGGWRFDPRDITIGDDVQVRLVIEARAEPPPDAR